MGKPLIDWLSTWNYYQCFCRNIKDFEIIRNECQNDAIITKLEKLITGINQKLKAAFTTNLMQVVNNFNSIGKSSAYITFWHDYEINIKYTRDNW